MKNHQVEIVESRFHFQRFLGSSLLLVGLVGIVYLGWVYLVWGKTLPKFTQAAIYTEDLESDFRSGSESRFGDLLDQEDRQDNVVAETPNLSDEILIARAEEQPQKPAVQGLLQNSDHDLNHTVTLTIPRLKIQDAKIELDINGDNESVYDTVLTRAVAHLNNSAYPGEFGNTFIFGHSKLPILAGSDYESIFTNLPKIKVGDVVKIKYRGLEYTYQINHTGVVDPSDVFIMNQPQSKKMLTLMTCIPPGFENQRYITVGELIAIE